MYDKYELSRLIGGETAHLYADIFISRDTAERGTNSTPLSTDLFHLRSIRH